MISCGTGNEILNNATRVGSKEFRRFDLVGLLKIKRTVTLVGEFSKSFNSRRLIEVSVQLLTN